MSTGSEFKRLLRRTMAGPDGAPWWARWLLQAAVLALVLGGIAAAIDWIWLYGLGRPPFALCALVDLIPVSLIAGLGMLVGIGGVIGLLLGARGVGLATMIIGGLMTAAPDILAASDLGARCPWVGLS